MRTIYAIQLMPKAETGQTATQSFGEIIERVCLWVERKYERAWKTNVSVSRRGEPITAPTNHNVKSSRRAVEDGELLALDWFHPDDHDDSVTWATTILVARKGQDVQFTLLIRIGSNRTVLRPVHYDLGRPRVVSEILDAYSTTVEGWPVPLSVEMLSASQVQPFVDKVLLNPARSLPVIMVSPDLWGGRYSVDPVQTFQTLKGFANVAVLEDKWAAFKLTDALERDLTCYDGSVRIYWPGLGILDNPYHHKLFLKNTILTFEERGQPLDRHLFRLLATIASYRYVEGPVIRSVRLAIEKSDSAHVETLRQQVKAGSLAKDELEGQLLEAWAQIDSITKERDDLREDLEAQVRAWSEIQNYLPTQDDEDEGAERGPRPRELRSVHDAVEKAQEEFGDTLVFLDSAVKLAEASPFQSPEVVYALFEALDELVTKWRNGESLGGSWKDVLESRGFDCKSDISHTCKQKKFISDYTFLYEGVKRVFGEHVTIGIGQDPQKCLSVHWWRDENKKVLVVGRCGKHGANTKT